MEVGSTIYIVVPTSNINIVMNCLETQVSFYESTFNKGSVATTNLFSFLDNEKYKEEIEKIRLLNNAKEIKRRKILLPCVTVSGIFNNRYATSLISHSGLIGIDIDASDNRHIPNFNMIAKDLIKIPNVAYCGRSVYSGYFLVIPISTPQNHRGHFLALKKLFKEQFSIIIDAQCVNINRLRAISYDPERYFNLSAIPYSGVLQEEHQQYREHKKINKEANGDNINSLQRAVDKIQELGLDITGNGQDWWRIGCAIASFLGEEGRDIFHTISQFYQNGKYHYTLNETDKKYDQCLNSNGEHRIGTFFWYYYRELKENCS